jgi:hypothetical protein
MFGVICIDGRNTFHLNALKFNKIFPVVISHPTPGAVQLQAMVKFEPWTATIQDVQFKYQNIELN